MITPLKSGDRASRVDQGRRSWASFDAEPGFRSLKALTEEDLAPGAGFQIEGILDLEVLLYVREGALDLHGPAGRTTSIEAGECHRTLARAGHPRRAMNASPTESARVFLALISPDHALLRTSPEKRRFSRAEREGVLKLLGSRGGRKDSLRLRQDVDVFSSILDSGQHVVHALAPRRGAWLHVVEGRIRMGDQVLERGDGTAVVDEPAVSLTAREPSEILLFDSV